MSSAAYRSRVRDQINRFNSVAVSQNNYNNNDDKTRDNIRQKRDNTTVRRHRSHTSESSKNFIGHANNDVTPPCNPNYYEKENSSNKVVADTATAKPSSSSYSFTSKEGVKALSPTSHHHHQQQQRKKSPKKNSSSSPKKTISASSPKKTSPIPSPYPKNTPRKEADNVIDETELLRKHVQALEKDNEKLMKRNARLERKCDKLARDNAQLKEDVDEAAFSKNDGGSETHHDHSNNRHRDENNIRNDDRDNQSNKRDPDEHPLIDSPLRKHMKHVHESAESNCTVTMKKAPFPLLPPEQSRAILEARKKEQEEEEGDCQHLDMLGNVTGSVSTQFEVDAKFGYKKRRGKRTKEGSGSSSVDEEEEAVDLLTSAAFMFKTSRRNLC